MHAIPTHHDACPSLLCPVSETLLLFEVFRQCVRAIVTARENNPEMAPHNYDTEYIQEHEVLRGFLAQVPPPMPHPMQAQVPPPRVPPMLPQGDAQPHQRSQGANMLEPHVPHASVRDMMSDGGICMTTCRHGMLTAPTRAASGAPAPRGLPPAGPA